MNHPHTNIHPSRYITNKAEGEKRQAFIERMAQALLKAEREGQKIVRIDDPEFEAWTLDYYHKSVAVMDADKEYTEVPLDLGGSVIEGSN